MTTVTFLQLRPATAVSDIWASTRRREGTLVVEVDDPGLSDIEQAQRQGLLLASRHPGSDAPAFVVAPDAAGDLVERSIDGWRITIVDSGDRMAVAESMAFSRASFLRTARSTVDAAVELVTLPGTHGAAVSVFVDTVDDGVDAVRRGARDLLLRGWDTESIGELRDALGGTSLVERTAFPIGVSYDDAVRALDSGAFSAYLNQIDGSGRARPRGEWAPGKDMDTPQAETRLSTAWRDAAWHEGERATLDDASKPVGGILERALDGVAPTRDEIEVLFRAFGTDVEAIADVADR
ncbi:MAG: hypothetical protein ABFR53_13000, partial [Actinomycetota bacterium]